MKELEDIILIGSPYFDILSIAFCIVVSLFLFIMQICERGYTHPTIPDRLSFFGDYLVRSRIYLGYVFSRVLHKLFNSAELIIMISSPTVSDETRKNLQTCTSSSEIFLHFGE